LGITLKGCNISEDVTTSGFFRLRRDISMMLSCDIGRYYDEMITVLRASDYVKKIWEKNINRAVNDYLATQNKSMERVIDFLFAPDTNGRITYGTCRLLIGIIDNNDRETFDNTLYGYAGWGDKACRGRNIYNILECCSNNKKPMIWY